MKRLMITIPEEIRDKLSSKAKELTIPEGTLIRLALVNFLNNREELLK